MSHWSLKSWRQRAKAGKDLQVGTIDGESCSQRETRRLRQEVDYLRRQREILKKSLGLTRLDLATEAFMPIVALSYEIPKSRTRPRPAAATRHSQAPLRVRWLGFASQARTLRCACANPSSPEHSKPSVNMNQSFRCRRGGFAHGSRKMIRACLPTENELAKVPAPVIPPAQRRSAALGFRRFSGSPWMKNEDPVMEMADEKKLCGSFEVHSMPTYTIFKLKPKADPVLRSSAIPSSPTCQTRT